MQEATLSQTTRVAPLPAAELRALSRRSDARGLLQAGGHLAACIASGALYALTPWASPWKWLSLVAYGFTLVTMFAAMHETVHRTAFQSLWLNNAMAWLAGVLSFYNATFYRHYHGWHHRFTQLPGQDPELDDPKPQSLGAYIVELSGIPWWIGKLKTYAALARGDTRAFPYLTDKTGPEAVRSVRLQLAVYAVAQAASLVLGQPYFVAYWLVPVAAAQPLLRAILLAEHTGCSHDGDPMSNTGTTLTSWPVRFLMWQMPYHAEHHRYPSLPFFALARAHTWLAPQLSHVARRGYVGVQLELVRSLLARRRAA